MKKSVKYILVPVCACILTCSFGQVDTAIDMNTLQSPNSPGSILLGVNPSDIQKPTDLNGIMMAVRNASSNFTEFPTSFAIDIAPAWLFGAKHITYDKFISNKKSFAQTFNFSYAQTSQNDSNYTGLKQGIGFSFSLIRPAIKDESFFSKVKGIRNITAQLQLQNLKTTDERLAADSSYQAIQQHIRDLGNEFDKLDDDTTSQKQFKQQILKDQIIILDAQRQIIADKITTQAKIDVDNLQTEKIEELKKLEEAITPVRKGFYLNFAAGTIVKYDNFKSNRSSLTNESAWLNFGFDGLKTDSAGKSYISILALSRVIFDNEDELYKSGNMKKFTTWDNGLKIGVTTTNQKFTFSGEALGRKLFNTDEGKSFVYKYNFNIDWSVGKNQRLTFSYGRDFGNHITKDGNVIGYINFVKGIFNKKPVNL